MSKRRAYIDPATTGLVIGIRIWPFIAGALAVVSGFFLKNLITPVKKKISDLWQKIKGKDQGKKKASK